eukprot:UN16045
MIYKNATTGDMRVLKFMTMLLNISKKGKQMVDHQADPFTSGCR